MKKILIVFGTFITVTLIFLGLINMDDIKAYINNEEVSDDTLALEESTESNEWSLDNESEVEAFVETEKSSENFASIDGTRPVRGDHPEDFDGERPVPPNGEFPSDDTHTGSTSTTTE